MLRSQQYFSLAIMFVWLIISSCTIGQLNNTNNNANNKNEHNQNTFFSLILLTPNSVDFAQLSVTPKISFKFNRNANHVDLDNVYIVDNNTAKIVPINGISERVDTDGATIYNIMPNLAYDSEYKLVFSNMIADDNGNKLNSVYYVFHTVKDDDSDTQKIKIIIDQPTSNINVDINQDIIFTSSERIDSGLNLKSIISLHEDSTNGNIIDIAIASKNNQYFIQHNALEYNKNYCLIISDSEHKSKNHNIGETIFYFHTASDSDYTQLVSQDSDLQSDSSILLYVKHGVELAQNHSFTLKDTKDNTDVGFNMQKTGDFYVLKPTEIRSTAYYAAKYKLTITYANKKQQSIMVNFARAGDYSMSLYDQNTLVYSCYLNQEQDTCRAIILKPEKTCLQPRVYDDTISLYAGNPKDGIVIPANMTVKFDGYSKFGSALYSFVLTPNQPLEANTQYVISVNNPILACSGTFIGRTTLLLVPK
jgi:hypothetical protein